MKKSELVKELQKEIKQFGDEYLMHVKITGENETIERRMLSQRRDESGQRKNMSVKEFLAWVKDQKSK